MNLTQAKITVTVIAAITAVLFVALAYFLPVHATFILSVEIIVLPSIYIVGNIFAESMIDERHEQKLQRIVARAQELNDKYFNERNKTLELQSEVRWLKENGKA